MKPLARAILALLTSSKLWVTAVAITYLRWDYWSDVKCLPGFTDANQLTAFAALNHDKNDTLKWIILGFLGITGGVQMAGGSVAQNLANRFRSQPHEPERTKSTKDLD